MAIRTRSKPREVKGNSPYRKEQPAPPGQLSILFDRVKNTDIPSTEVIVRAAWICFLLVCYVFFQNRYDKLTYETAQAKRDMNEKSALYISQKESYSFQSKHSEISEKLKYRGLDESLSPPIKIEVVRD